MNTHTRKQKILVGAWTLLTRRECMKWKIKVMAVLHDPRATENEHRSLGKPAWIYISH